LRYFPRLEGWGETHHQTETHSQSAHSNHKSSSTWLRY